MATARIPEQIQRVTAEGLHRYARRLLNEMKADQGKAYAVAAAGAHYAGDENMNVKSLFEVIGTICEDATVSASLSAVIDQLSKLAGSAMPRAEAREEG